MNTLIVVGTAIPVSIALGCFLAWSVTKTDVPYAGVLEKLIIVGFLIPPSLTALAWSLLAHKRTGLLNLAPQKLLGLDVLNINSLAGISWHMVTTFTSFAVLLIVPAFRSMDASLEERGGPREAPVGTS